MADADQTKQEARSEKTIDKQVGKIQPIQIENSSENDPIELGNVSKTADNNIILAIGNDDQFYRFCKFTNNEDLTTDIRFSTNAERVKNRNVILPIIQGIIEKKESKFWLNELAKINVSCGPINTLKEVFDDPQIKARNMRLKMSHQEAGEESLELIGSPFKMSKTPVSFRHSPPTLGQHTEEVLKELIGTSSEEIASLKKEGVI